MKKGIITKSDRISYVAYDDAYSKAVEDWRNKAAALQERRWELLNKELKASEHRNIKQLFLSW